jgi:N-formylmaleamate deformylase
MRLSIRLGFLVFLVAASADAQTERPRAFAITRSGSGPALVFVPGLGTPGEVWQGTVAHLSARHACHVLHLAGFAGLAPVAAPSFLGAVRDDLVAYVREQKLDRPVLIGHSLGAVIAYAAAAAAPDLFGGVVAVDGVPFLPALLDPSATPESLTAQAAGMRRFYAAMSREQVEGGTRAAAARMVREPAQLDRIVAWTGRSDPATLGQALYEVMTTDLRAAVAGVRVPTLLVGAGADAPDAGARASTLASYEAQVRAIPDHRVVLAEKARHFVMLDDPEFLYRAVDGFLAGLAKRPQTEGTTKK